VDNSQADAVLGLPSDLGPRRSSDRGRSVSRRFREGVVYADDSKMFWVAASLTTTEKWLLGMSLE